MNPDDPGPSGEPAKKKQRGPYKQYLLDPSKAIPRTTLISRKKAEDEAALHDINEEQAAAAQHLEAEVPTFGTANAPEPPVTDVRDDDQEDVQDQLEMIHGAAANPVEPPLMEPMQDAVEREDVPNQEGLVQGAYQTGKKDINYIEKYQLNKLLHKDFPSTRLDVLLMILHLAVRHCNTENFIKDQIKFVNILFGENTLDVSHYIFQQLFQPLIKIVKHYYCVKCELYLGSSETFDKDLKFIQCTTCKENIDVHSVDSGNYFITLSIGPQIQDLLKKPNVKVIPHVNRASGNISDIMDGEIYRSLTALGFPLSNKSALTVTFNTDGVAVFKSAQNSLWPIWLQVNEICLEERFKTENLILAGLWFGKSAPNMSMFMKPFIADLLDLSVNGVDCVQPDGSIVKCPVFPLALSVDSVAKAKVLCKKQFNAYTGCLYCFHPNDSFIGNDKLHRFYDMSAKYDLRTEENVISDMYVADQMQRQNELKDGSVNGFLGISVLLEFTKLLDNYPRNTFHIVWGVVIDYLHCVLEGCASDLFCLISNNILTPEQLQKIDDRLKEITPPQAMTRRPRSFSSRTYWKAKEFRAFLLYYALPCLEDLLPKTYFDNLTHFVNAMHILLSDSISSTQLAEARSDLEKFTVGFQKIYGLHNVTYNIHLCTHLVDLVAKMGPLFCYSNFVFESGNGFLVRLLRGTKTVVNELSTKYCTIQTASKCIKDNPVTPEALKFCSGVMGYEYSKSHEKYDDVSVTGSFSTCEVDNEEQRLLAENSVLISDNKVRFYNRVIRKGIVYCSKSYSSGKVYDDSCVMLTNGMYAAVDKIVISSTKALLCVMKPIRIAEGSGIISTIKKCSFDVFDDKVIVPFNNIVRKCFYVAFEDKSFVCHVPNFYERD